MKRRGFLSGLLGIPAVLAAGKVEGEPLERVKEIARRPLEGGGYVGTVLVDGQYLSCSCGVGLECDGEELR